MQNKFILSLIIMLAVAASADACCLFGLGSRLRARVAARRAARAAAVVSLNDVCDVQEVIAVVKTRPIVARRVVTAPVFAPRARLAPGLRCLGGACRVAR